MQGGIAECRRYSTHRFASMGRCLKQLLCSAHAV